MARISVFRSVATRVALAATILIAVGCGGSSDFKSQAQGAPYEVVVVADHDVWDGAPGDSLRAIFYRQFPMVNRQETSFDVLRVLPSGFKRLIMRHRNVLIAAIDPTASATLSVGQDTWSRPQTVLSAVAPDAESLTELIAQNGENIALVLENAEKERDVANATGHTPPAVASLIREKFGFDMATGPGYTVRSESENFLWLSYEMPIASQGIVIYSYPFSGVRDFDRELLMVRRNEFVKRIPGENPGSHMSTVSDFTSLAYKTIEGRPWSELHGFWKVEGDFMGGPYTNYSTIDVANQRVIAIDFYVYSPDGRLSQRNYIKQLEHFIYTVRVPGPAEGTAAAAAGAAEGAEGAAKL